VFRVDSVMRREEYELISGRERPIHVDEHFDLILVAAQANAGWAFEQLFHTFAPRVTSYLRAQGAAEPDELANDVFIAVFRALGRFEGDEAAFRSWLFTIARNQLVDERRRRARRASVVPADLSAFHDKVGGDVEAEALANTGREWVQAVTARLAPAQREVLLLRIVADLTIDQIAHVVGKRPGAVKALQRRGLAAVKRLLEETGVPLDGSTDV
jgi:RNA polymerase sigma-70 factor (ECF subfamily)